MEPLRYNEIGPSPNKNFGTLADAAQFNVKDRPGQWEYNVSVQHELMSRLSVSMAYYRRNYYNFWREDNVLQSNSDYNPFAFTGPADPRLNEFAGSHTNAVQPESDGVRPVAACPQQRRQYRRPGNVRLYNGLEWTVQGRFGKGGFFGGSVNYEKTQENTCSVENRNSTIWCDAPRAWQTQFKANASYPIPKVDIVTSATPAGVSGAGHLGELHRDARTVLCSDRRRADGRCEHYLRSASAGYLLPPVPDEGGSAVHEGVHDGDHHALRRRLDIFNLLNANTTTSINNTCCSTALTGWQAITSVMQARQVRIGLQLDW